ncbi:hypothetical protein LCGC14_0484880 [marine sediment metagenome]|uniref:Uncharacterized protein n=1 Tax=marine sediment metagenome TaxID=412755 RepID=A0A0F9S865_9ZZZZ
MGNLMSIVMIVFTINLFLIIGGYNVGREAISAVFDIPDDNSQFSFNPNATGAIPINPQTNTFESSQSTFNFVDAIKLPFEMAGIIISLVIAPINIAFALGMPFAINLLLFGPMTIMFYIAIFIWFRGGGG